MTRQCGKRRPGGDRGDCCAAASTFAPRTLPKKIYLARGCNGTAAVLIWDSGGNTRRLANASCIDWICRPGRGLDSGHFPEQRAALARPRHLVYPPAEWRRVGLLL